MKVNFRPRTPVAIRVVYISAAGEQFDVASAAEISASPTGEDVGVKDIALISTFGIGRGAEEKELAKIAAGKVKTATRSFGERRNLRGGGFQQVCERVLASNGEDVAAVARTGQQVSALVESEGINQIVMRGPDTIR